jgi:hypothetical protein
VVQVIVSQPVQTPTPVENWAGLAFFQDPVAPFYCYHFLLLRREIYFHCSEFPMNGFSSEELPVKNSICDGDQQK